MTCAACAFENRVLARYCGQCGVSLRPLARCPRCSTPNPVDYAFCDSCGTTFSIGSGQIAERGVTAASGLERVGAAVATAGAETAVAERPAQPVGQLRAGSALADRPDDAPLAAPDADVSPPPDTALSRTLAFAARHARLLTLVGVATAIGSEVYLQYATPSNRTRTVGLLGLIVASALFGLGASKSYLPAALRRPRLRSLNPLELLRAGTASVGAGVGVLACLTLFARLYFGSTVATDLILWGVSLGAFTLVFADNVKSWRPARSALLEIASVAAITLLAIVLNARDLNHWYYSVIGDEYAFLSQANSVLVDGIRRPFAQDGVYGAHPVLGSIFQAGVMRIFGRDHFGWSMSSVLSHALAIPAIYSIGRTIGGRAVGLVAAGMFGFSHYLFAFSHLGYNNIMAQAPTAWAIACFLLYLRQPRIWLLYAAGIAAGLGFYTFYSARTTLAILGLFVLIVYGWRACLTPRGFRDRLTDLWPMIVGFLLTVLPIFAASGTAVITRMFNEVPGGYSSSITGPPGQKIVSNFWLNVPVFFQGTHAAHFTSGSLLDPLTAALAALGIGAAIRWRSNAAASLLLVWTGLAVGSTALLSPHPTPVFTRLLFAVPPFALLGAIGARQVWEQVPWPRRDSMRQWAGAGAVIVVLAAVLGLNLHRFWVTTPATMHLTQDAMVIGALRSGICGQEPARTVLVMRGHGLVRGALNSYRANLAERDLPRLIPHADLKPGEPIPLDGARCVIFGDPNDEPSRRAIDDLKRAHPNGEVRPFNDLSGRGTIQIFIPNL